MSDDLDRFLAEDCAECGTPGPQRHLSAVGGCATCVAENPWPVYIPVRNVLMSSMLDAARVVAEQSRHSPFRTAARHDPPGPFGECYQMTGGQMVHVRPGCRCKT